MPKTPRRPEPRPGDTRGLCYHGLEHCGATLDKPCVARPGAPRPARPRRKSGR